MDDQKVLDSRLRTRGGRVSIWHVPKPKVAGVVIDSLWLLTFPDLAPSRHRLHQIATFPTTCPPLQFTSAYRAVAKRTCNPEEVGE